MTFPGGPHSGFCQTRQGTLLPFPASRSSCRHGTGCLRLGRDKIKSPAVEQLCRVMPGQPSAVCDPALSSGSRYTRPGGGLGASQEPGGFAVSCHRREHLEGRVCVCVSRGDLGDLIIPPTARARLELGQGFGSWRVQAWLIFESRREPAALLLSPFASVLPWRPKISIGEQRPSVAARRRLWLRRWRRDLIVSELPWLAKNLLGKCFSFSSSRAGL